MMTDNDDSLAILRRIEQNQLRALELQAEQLALVKAQMERSESRVQESIALQKVANSRQARALNFVIPVVVLALAYLGYLMFRYS